MVRQKLGFAVPHWSDYNSVSCITRLWRRNIFHIVGCLKLVVQCVITVKNMHVKLQPLTVTVGIA